MRSQDASEQCDELLSDYFKSKLRQPWPPAPAVSSAPASLIAARRHSDQAGRARLTLAASVALLVGVCWYFSATTQPGNRSAPPTPAGPAILDESSATRPKEFDKKMPKANPAVPAVPMLN